MRDEAAGSCPSTQDPAATPKVKAAAAGAPRGAGAPGAVRTSAGADAPRYLVATAGPSSAYTRELVSPPASQLRSTPPMATATGPWRAGTSPYMHSQVARIPAKKAVKPARFTFGRRRVP